MKTESKFCIESDNGFLQTFENAYIVERKTSELDPDQG
jgi:hypothetical protein